MEAKEHEILLRHQDAALNRILKGLESNDTRRMTKPPKPRLPAIGTKYLDAADDTLHEWDGKQWKPAVKEEMDKEKAELLLNALECLWSEHYIGNKEMTDKIREVATLLRQKYNIEKKEFEEF